MTGTQVKTACQDLLTRYTDGSVNVIVKKGKCASYDAVKGVVTKSEQKYTGQVFYDSDSGKVYISFYSSDTTKLSSYEAAESCGTYEYYNNGGASF